MYVQSPGPAGQGHITLPKGYSGNAFTAAPSAQAPAARDEPDAIQEKVPPEIPSQAEEPTPEKNNTPSPHDGDGATAANAAAQTFSSARDRQYTHSFFEKLPLLSSLLPPPRHKKERNGLPEWAVIGLVLFLFLDDRKNDNDLFPFLLLLLLWE